MIRRAAQLLDAGVDQVIVKGHPAVDEAGAFFALGQDFDNPVGDGIDEFVVVRVKKDNAGEGDQAVVEGGDSFKVEVVGRLVEDQHVCAGEHHFGEHAADFFAA